ncbi:MAG: hypothetical protein RL885_18930 [Planctomycetota bacterium]
MTLVISLKRGRNGQDSLACRRNDGTATWRRLQPGFASHDLRHFAVESTLGVDSAFYGLIARGWNLEDFGAPWPKGRLPEEAAWVECTIAAIWSDRDHPALRSTEEINSAIREMQRGASFERRLTSDEIRAIRECFDEQIERWRRLDRGEVMELEVLV